MYIWRLGSHFHLRDGNSMMAHITSSKYEDMKNQCSFWYFFKWRLRLDEMCSPQFKVDPLVMIWYIMGIHLFGKLESSFLLNTLDSKITMLWVLFLNLEVFNSIDAYLALSYPSYHYPFIIVRKSANSFFCFSHSGVTLIWASLKWYIWLSIDDL